VIGPIGQVAIKVGSLAAGRDFYGRVLGLTESFAAPNVIAYDVNGVRWLLIDHQGFIASEAAGTTVYLCARQLERQHAELIAAGAADGGTPHCIAVLDEAEVWIGFVKDPFNNVIGLIEERPTGTQPAGQDGTSE
jgi:catechol 2,3-dioxygenase-like lactoylglutathione lyase family enzyme